MVPPFVWVGSNPGATPGTVNFTESGGAGRLSAMSTGCGIALRIPAS